MNEIFVASENTQKPSAGIPRDDIHLDLPAQKCISFRYVMSRNSVDCSDCQPDCLYLSDIRWGNIRCDWHGLRTETESQLLFQRLAAMRDAEGWNTVGHYRGDPARGEPERGVETGLCGITLESLPGDGSPGRNGCGVGCGCTSGMFPGRGEFLPLYQYCMGACGRSCRSVWKYKYDG